MNKKTSEIQKIENIMKNFQNLSQYEIDFILPRIIKFIEKYDVDIKKIYERGQKESNKLIKTNNKHDFQSRCYVEKNGSILVIYTNKLEIRIFTSDEDYIQYFCPLKKLNDIEINKNIVINKLYDYDSEFRIIVEQKLVNISKYFCEILSKLKTKKNIFIFLIKIFKTFFRTIFLLYLKNDQVDMSINLSNMGIENFEIINNSEIIDQDNLDSLIILSSNLINSKYLKTPINSNKIDNYLAKRYMYQSFKYFRESILIELNNCKVKNKISSLIQTIIFELKEYYKSIDLILTDEYSTDKIIKGKTEFINVRSFKFLNIDDIIGIIKKIDYN